MPPTGDLLTTLQQSRAALDESDPPAFERGADGVWRYAATDVPIVGGIDVSLDEVLDVRRVVRRSGPEAVLLSAAEIDATPALVWVRERGRRLRADDGDEEFEVAPELWAEHAAAPVGVRAPERDATGIARLAAIEERELRFARREVELRAERRARYVAVMTALGMTRREVGECIGVTPARVQQVVEDLPPPVRTEVDDLMRDALAVLRQLGGRTVEREQVDLPEGRDGRFLDELVAYGLVEDVGSAVQQTAAGERAELHLRTRRKT